MKKWLLALVIFLALERFCYFQTDGFILSKMLLENVPPSPGPTETLTFIGAGKQFYVFETDDHQHVVKFIKFSRRRSLPWLAKLPFITSWSSRFLADRAKRLCDLESSSDLALKYLAPEAGLAPYPLQKNLILIDKLGIAHRIDRSQTRFLVQKKAIPFTVYFDEHPLEAQSLIISYMKTIASQCQKGICNLDTLIERNYGVVNHQIILMDIGSLIAHSKLSHKAGMQREIFVELLPLRQWLQNNYPKHVIFFDQSLRHFISSDN